MPRRNPFSGSIFGQNQSAPCSPGCPSGPDVKEFKTCIAEVQRENPDLATSAVQQIALQRYSKKNDRKTSSYGADCELRSSTMGDVFSKFRIGKAPSETRSSFPTQYKRSSSDASTEFLPGRRQSIAPRKSASNLEGSTTMNADIQAELEALESVGSMDSGFLDHMHSSKSSLEQSLSKIEFEFESPHSHSNHARRISHRESGVSSELANVLEDAELDNSDNSTKDHASQNNLGDSQDFYVELNDLQSISAQLEETRVKMEAPTEVENGNNAISPNQNGTRRRSAKSYLFDSLSGNSFTESESSFQGDFSAWRRSSRLSIKSHRGSCSSSTSSLGDDDGFMAFMGDFSAWRRSKRELKHDDSEEKKKKEAAENA